MNSPHIAGYCKLDTTYCFLDYIPQDVGSLLTHNREKRKSKMVNQLQETISKRHLISHIWTRQSFLDLVIPLLWSEKSCDNWDMQGCSRQKKTIFDDLIRVAWMTISGLTYQKHRGHTFVWEYDCWYCSVWHAMMIQFYSFYILEQLELTRIVVHITQCWQCWINVNNFQQFLKKTISFNKK